MSTILLVERKAHGVVELTLNRPDVRNAFDEHLITEWNKTLDILQHESNLRLLIIQGSGNTFSSGADLNWMKKMAQYSKTDNLKDAKALWIMMERLYYFPHPTIAFVKGAAFGGALGLLACCDMVYADSKTSFCFSECKLGLIPAVITPFVIQAIGLKHARSLFLSARLFDAQHAERIGLVTSIYDDLDRSIPNIIQNLLQLGPVAQHTLKTLLHRLYPLPSHAAEITTEAIAELRVLPEAQERMSAFFDKRPPK